MSTKKSAVVLRGGLDNGTTLSGLDQISQVSTKKKGEIHLWTPPSPEEKSSSLEEDRIDGSELLKHVMEFAGRVFEWTLSVALPFIREMGEVDDAFLFDICEDGEEETNEDRLADYEQTLSALRSFSPENDQFLNEEQQKGKREKFLNTLCQRVRHMAELAVLVDDVRHAENKGELETLLERVRDGRGKDAKRVFSFCSKQDADFWAFGKPYRVSSEAFGHFHGFAVEKLSEAVLARSKEISSAFKAELKEERKRISEEANEDISAEDLFFGNPDEIDGKAASLSWMNKGKKNVIRVSLENDRVYILGVVGPGPQRTFEDMKGLSSKPYIPLKAVLHQDGEVLCLSKGDEGMYRFGTFVQDRKVLTMCRWVRTALGAMMPHRLHPDDPAKRAPVAEGNEKPKGDHVSAPLEDTDGHETVPEKVFFFRKNGGAGTISIVLPEGFELHLPEVKNEKQEIVAKERKIRLATPATLTVRRIIVSGETRIVVDGCDNEEILQELKLCGIPKVAWKDDPKKKRFGGLPIPLPAILAFAFGQAKKSGKLD